MSERDLIMQRQDDCLTKMENGLRPPNNVLYKLPPWRAVMIARIAHNMGVMSTEEVYALIDQAKAVGGDGQLTEPK